MIHKMYNFPSDLAIFKPLYRIWTFNLGEKYERW